VKVKSGQNGSTVIAEDDDSGGELNAEVLFLARANQTYYIHAQMVGGEGGAYTLKAAWTEPPTEVQPDIPVGGALPGEQAWTFTAPATQRVLLQLNDLEFDPHIVVREGEPGGKVVAEVHSSKTVVFQAEAGTTYYIQVGVSEGMEEGGQMPGPRRPQPER
jgi:hypothetical protein